jgi:ribosome recycling factor
MTDYKKIIENIKPELEKALSFFEGELRKIRTSMFSPSLIEDIKVNLEGAEVTIKELAAVSLLSPREMVIQPWDKSYVQPIEKAISDSNLGASPITSKDNIRLSAPAVSEEYRGGLLRNLSGKQEDARKTIRHFREEAWEKIQENCKEGLISEDDKFRAKDELQKLVDQYKDKISQMAESKRREIEGK